VNERIENLWYQAGGHYNSGNQHTWPEYTIDDPEKFAELIVRECVSICQDVDGEDNIDARSGRQDCAVEIKEHFGVEEQVTESNELHTCPFAEEIHHDFETLCDCDEERTIQCRMDI
jgi:hypothetical protein